MGLFGLVWACLGLFAAGVCSLGDLGDLGELSELGELGKLDILA